MKVSKKRLTVQVAALALLLGTMLTISAVPASTASAEVGGNYTGGSISTETKNNKTTITVTPDSGYELKAGSLIVTDRCGDEYVPTRVGFRKTDDSTEYTVETSAPIMEIGAEFYKPSTKEPNIGNVDALVDTDVYGLRLVSRINRTVEDGKLYINLDGGKKLIKDYGVLLALKDAVGDITEITKDNDEARCVSALESQILYDSCDSYMDISVIVANTDKITGATKSAVLSRSYVELEDGTVLYGGQFDTTYRKASNITEPGSVVLTTSNAYPVWDEAGNKTIQVKVTSMTGEEKLLILNNSEEITVIPGKVYVAKYRSDNTAALIKCEKLVYRGNMSANDNDVLTITRAGIKHEFHLASDAFKYKVASSGNAGYYRLTLTEEGIGSVSSSYNAIYGTDELGDISFILTTTNGVTAYNSLYGASDNHVVADTPDVVAPTFETAPVAFVTKAPYFKDGQYVVDLKDIFGTTYEAIPFDYTTTDYPKLNLPYIVTITDGMAVLEKLTTATTKAEKGMKYEEGVLSRTDNNNSYTITADTYIFYVERLRDASGNLSELTFVNPADVPTNLTNGGITANAFNIIQSNNMKAPGTTGDFVQWMMVEVNNRSIYNLTDTSQGWYTVSQRVTRLADQILLMTSDLRWDETQQKYLIDAVDMNGKERTLVYTENESGVLPVKGKVFLVTMENSVMKFTWASSIVNAKDTKENVFYDVLRACITEYDAENKKITVNGGKQYILAENVKILGADRFDGNETYLAKYTGLKDTIISTTSNYNAMFGLNADGEVVWILNNTGGKTIYNVADNTSYEAPTLPEKN